MGQAHGSHKRPAEREPREPEPTALEQPASAGRQVDNEAVLAACRQLACPKGIGGMVVRPTPCEHGCCPDGGPPQTLVFFAREVRELLLPRTSPSPSPSPSPAAATLAAAAAAAAAKAAATTAAAKAETAVGGGREEKSPGGKGSNGHKYLLTASAGGAAAAAAAAAPGSTGNSHEATKQQQQPPGNCDAEEAKQFSLSPEPLEISGAMYDARDPVYEPATNCVIYRDGYALMRLDAANAVSLVAGSRTEHGHADGVGGAARFGLVVYSLVGDGRGRVFLTEGDDIRMLEVATGEVRTLRCSAPLHNGPWLALAYDEYDGSAGALVAATKTAVCRFPPCRQQKNSVNPQSGSSSSRSNNNGNVSEGGDDISGPPVLLAGCWTESGHVDGRGGAARFEYISSVLAVPPSGGGGVVGGGRRGQLLVAQKMAFRLLAAASPTAAAASPTAAASSRAASSFSSGQNGGEGEVDVTTLVTDDSGRCICVPWDLTVLPGGSLAWINMYDIVLVSGDTLLRYRR